MENGQVTEVFVLTDNLNVPQRQTYNASRDMSLGCDFQPNAEMRREFRRRLLRWYDCHKRDLPWRRSREPYRVWLSEIMLQQTRVAVVIEYYRRFLKRFPTVHELAKARTASVLAAWSGLGYYRRALMLHAAAKKIVGQHGGEFPRTSQELRVLPGVGRYTAGAIASIACGEAVAALDGNVARVLQRIQGRRADRKQLWQVAENLVSRSRPGDFNQAMMELGATLCLPRQPKCLKCPVAKLCAARGPIEDLTRKKRRKREIYYTLDCRNGSVFLVQRPRDVSLMPGMWELPEAGSWLDKSPKDFTLRHSITVTDYVVRISRQPAPGGTKGRWVSRSELQQLALTGLSRKILRAAKII
jgi:A/G-specific adenine glycosylase